MAHFKIMHIFSKILIPIIFFFSIVVHWDPIAVFTTNFDKYRILKLLFLEHVYRNWYKW